MLSIVAVVLATLLGPIIAVQIQKLLERMQRRSDGRMRVFKTLMTTRAATLSLAHVEALNMIDLEFPPGGKRFKAVQEAWKAYRTSLFETPPQDEKELAIFYADRPKLLAEMLYQMGKAVGYNDLDKTQIQKEGYYTTFQSKVDADSNILRSKLVEIVTGQATLPMSVKELPGDPELIAAQTAYLKAIGEVLSSGRPIPITVVSSAEKNAATISPQAEATELTMGTAAGKR